jgi:hypothetical protein
MVERRYGRDEFRTRRITGRVREGYDAWYVTTGMGMTYCDNGKDLRRVDTVTHRSVARLAHVGDVLVDIAITAGPADGDISQVRPACQGHPHEQQMVWCCCTRARHGLLSLGLPQCGWGRNLASRPRPDRSTRRPRILACGVIIAAVTLRAATNKATIIAPKARSIGHSRRNIQTYRAIIAMNSPTTADPQPRR